MIDSDETARAVDYCRRLYKETMLEDCLGWTDVSNNKAFLSEQISCTNNAELILWSAKKDFPDMAKVIDQSQNPQGAEGPLPHAEPAGAMRSSPTRRTRRRPRTSCAG